MVRDRWSDRDFLLAASNAAAEIDLWAAAARFGEGAVSPDPREVESRIEIAWRMWRAGWSAAAFDLLEAVPDLVNPGVPVLRAAAVATRDRTQAATDELLQVVSKRPVPMALLVVALAGRELGEDALSRGAAQQYLATVRSDQPVLRRIVAPAQALDGEMTAAVASTELACAALAAVPDTPIEQVTAELRDAGGDEGGHGVVARYLAEGFRRTGRLRYGELLEPLVRTSTRQRGPRVVVPVLVGALAVLIGITLPWPSEAKVAVLVPLWAACLAAAGWALAQREPGTTFTQTAEIADAVSGYRKRIGRANPTVPVLVAALLGFAAGAWKGFTRTSATLESVVLLPLYVGLGWAVVAALAVFVIGRRRRARIRAKTAAAVPVDRCRCWERDWFAGPTWRRYRDEHLTVLSADERLGAVLLSCAATTKTWVHITEADVTVRVVLPEPADPEQSAAYL